MSKMIKWILKKRYSSFPILFLIIKSINFIFFSSKVFYLSAFVRKKKKLMEKNTRQIEKSFSHKIVEKVAFVSQTRASRAKVFHNYASFLF